MNMVRCLDDYSHIYELVQCKNDVFISQKSNQSANFNIYSVVFGEAYHTHSFRSVAFITSCWNFWGCIVHAYLPL